MGIYTSPVALSRAQHARFSGTRLKMREVHEILVKAGVEDHKLATSGFISSKVLASLGHPFARAGNAGRGVANNASKYLSGGSFGMTSTDPNVGKKGKVKLKTTYQINITHKSTGWSKVGSSQMKGASTRATIQPLPINKQSGQLAASFFKLDRGSDGTTVMGFASPHAIVLRPQGTSIMVGRGFYSLKSNGTAVNDLGWLAKRHKARSAGLIRAVRDVQRII